MYAASSVDYSLILRIERDGQWTVYEQYQSPGHCDDSAAVGGSHLGQSRCCDGKERRIKKIL